MLLITMLKKIMLVNGFFGIALMTHGSCLTVQMFDSRNNTVGRSTFEKVAVLLKGFAKLEFVHCHAGMDYRSAAWGCVATPMLSIRGDNSYKNTMLPEEVLKKPSVFEEYLTELVFQNLYQTVLLRVMESEEKLIYDQIEVSNVKFDSIVRVLSDKLPRSRIEDQEMLIYFYASWSRQSIDLAAMWNKVARLSYSHLGRTVFAALDISGNERLCSHFGIESVPTIMRYLEFERQPGYQTSYRYMDKYNGTYDVKSVLKFAFTSVDDIEVSTPPFEED